MKLTGKFKVELIKKKTSAVFFKDLVVGDIFTLSYNVNGYYKSAPSINIYKNNKFAHSNNALQLHNNLKNFDVEQIV